MGLEGLVEYDRVDEDMGVKLGGKTGTTKLNPATVNTKTQPIPKYPALRICLIHMYGLTHKTQNHIVTIKDLTTF